MKLRILVVFLGLAITLPLPASHAQKNKSRRNPSLAPQTASTKSLVREAIEYMTRVIEIYSSTKSLRGTHQYIRNVENTTDTLRKRLRESDPMLQHLLNARYSLVRAEAFFKAKVEPKKITQEESFALVEMADDYDCPTDSSDTILMDPCIKIVMDEARQNRTQAFSAAIAAGFYSP